MPRVVFDVNVYISALLSPRGAPAELMRRWLAGAFDLVVSRPLLAELERALSYPKLTGLVTRDEARAFVEELRNYEVVVHDPSEVPRVTGYPDDDYLIALARASRANVVVSGDSHITATRGLEPPALTPRAFLDLLERA